MRENCIENGFRVIDITRMAEKVGMHMHIPSMPRVATRQQPRRNNIASLMHCKNSVGNSAGHVWNIPHARNIAINHFYSLG